MSHWLQLIHNRQWVELCHSQDLQHKLLGQCLLHKHNRNQHQYLDQQFQDALRQLQDEFERERGSVAAAAARQRKEATDVAAAMAAGFNEAEAEARQEYEAARWAAGPAAVVLHQCMLCSTFCL